jgi:hypothetical protein
MSDIFISYKREEQPVARKLADALEKKGWSVWWDPKIRTGEHFDDVIEKALTDARCVIVIWSRLSVESRYIKDEATYALNRDKLVPIAIEEVNLPFRFEGVQTGQLYDWDGSETYPGYQKLIADIVKILGKPPIGVDKAVLAKKVEAENKETTTIKADAAEPQKTETRNDRIKKPSRRKKKLRSAVLGGLISGSIGAGLMLVFGLIGGKLMVEKVLAVGCIAGIFWFILVMIFGA